VIEKVRAFLLRDDKVKDALDVACGTGLSTRALKVLARNIIGADISSEVLQQASARSVATFHFGGSI